MEEIQNENISIESNNLNTFDEKKLINESKDINLKIDEVKENNDNSQALLLDHNKDVNLEKEISDKFSINETKIKMSELNLSDKKLKNDKKIEEDTSEDEYYDVSSDGTLNGEIEELNSLSLNKSLNIKSEVEREQGDGEVY